VYLWHGLEDVRCIATNCGRKLIVSFRIPGRLALAAVIAYFFHIAGLMCPGTRNAEIKLDPH
jgi:hypothetical protein